MNDNTQTIWKFTFKIQDDISVKMPKGAQLLCVKANGKDRIDIWALVYPSTKLVDRKLVVYGTGNPCSGGAQPEHYVGTVHTDTNDFHVFDRG